LSSTITLSATMQNEPILVIGGAPGRAL